LSALVCVGFVPAAEEEGAVAAVVALVAEDGEISGKGGFEGRGVAGLAIAGDIAVRW